MRKLTAILVIVLATTGTAIAQEFLFDPPQPDSSTEARVILRGWGLSGPCGVGTSTRVERAGEEIEIFVEFPFHGACGSGSIAWTQVANLGTLPAGAYVVRVRPEGPLESPTAVLFEESLVVTDADAPFRVEPNAASVAGGEVLLLAGADPFCENECVDLEVLFDGVPGEVVNRGSARGPITVVAPPHDAGPVDVEVRNRESSLIARLALRYYDPADSPDPTLFEPILIPLLYRGKGVMGSEWDTYVRIYNHTSSDSSVARRGGRPILFFDPSIGLLEDGDSRLIPPGPELDPTGLLLWPVRTAADGVGVAARIVEATTGDEIQLPIVRERDFLRGRFTFPEIPAPQGSRISLRVYSLDSGTLGVIVSRANTDSETNREYGRIVLQRTHERGPWHAEIPDLHAWAPSAVIDELVRISIGTPLGTRAGNDTSIRFWALVSVTDNETQRVRLFVPR